MPQSFGGWATTWSAPNYPSSSLAVSATAIESPRCRDATGTCPTQLCCRGAIHLWVGKAYPSYSLWSCFRKKKQERKKLEMQSGRNLLFLTLSPILGSSGAVVPVNRSWKVWSAHQTRDQIACSILMFQERETRGLHASGSTINSRILLLFY